jgi:hypothetical protein
MNKIFFNSKPVIILAKIIILNWLAIFVIGGCTYSRKHYPGPELDRDQLSVIIVKPPINYCCIDGCKKEVPGKRSVCDTSTKIELLPGDHSIHVIYSGYHYRGKEMMAVNFHAKAGHTYRIRAAVELNPPRWSPYIEDITKNK